MPSSATIFKFPNRLVGINEKAQLPELFSIGPYHWHEPNLQEFEEKKLFYLHKFLSRASSIAAERDLNFYIQEMQSLETRTREAYAEEIHMASEDFVEMMLVDGCFIVELLRRLDPRRTEDYAADTDPISTRPWLIPIIIQDLLKLENQLPFFVLDSLFRSSSVDRPRTEHVSLTTLVLLVFDLVFPRPSETIKRFEHCHSAHLLHLFRESLLSPIKLTTILLRKSLLPTIKLTRMVKQRRQYRPSAQSMQNVSKLKPSGVKFRAKTFADTFLGIKFYRSYNPVDLGKCVLEIPQLNVNDCMRTLLINCIALEQCSHFCSKNFTDYVQTEL